MRIAHAELYQYTLPLDRPITVETVSLEQREGLLLKLTGDSGDVGWGEAAPLPGWSPESLAQGIEQFRSIRSDLLDIEVPSQAPRGPGSLITWFANLKLETGNLRPEYKRRSFFLNDPAVAGGLADQEIGSSVRFALESALFHAAAACWKVPFTTVLTDAPRSRILLNALIQDASVNVVRAVVASGYRAIKLKVGRQQADEEIDKIRRVREVAGPDISIRLDANRAWSLEEALLFAEQVEGLDIEYLEEPVSDPESLIPFMRASAIPMALDESLAELSVDRLNEWPGLAAIVLKPTLLGGIIKTLAWGHRALRLGIKPVISASYESGVGTALLGQLAACLGESDIPAGLDTYRCLKKDTLLLPLDSSGGALDVKEAARRATAVDVARLTRLDYE